MLAERGAAEGAVAVLDGFELRLDRVDVHEAREQLEAAQEQPANESQNDVSLWATLQWIL